MPTKRPKKVETITLNMPRPMVKTLNEAAHLGGLTLSQIVNAIIALRLVTLTDGPILAGEKPDPMKQARKRGRARQ
jgi:hypothetical protein